MLAVTHELAKAGQAYHVFVTMYKDLRLIS